MTEAGISSCLRDVQPLKHPFPIEIKVDGRISCLSRVQPQNASSPINIKFFWKSNIFQI